MQLYYVSFLFPCGEAWERSYYCAKATTALRRAMKDYHKARAIEPELYSAAAIALGKLDDTIEELHKMSIGF